MAFYSKEIGKSGKRGVTFQRSASFSGVPLRLPCGQCAGCRLERSRQWAIRCMHERQLYDDNEFLTLTYDPAFLPEGGTLVKRDLQLFMKRLRKKYGKGVRFYACGEYGERNGRPHYHAIVFNWTPGDKKFFAYSKRGEKYYTSESVRELWPFGHNVLADVTFDSCAYVARYVMDKINGALAVDHYQRVDRDGCVFNLEPEFCNMSRRPGIGSAWFDKFSGEAYAFDSVIMNGREIRPPRFYDTRYEAIAADRLVTLKKKRMRKAVRQLRNNRVDRLRIREVVLLRKMSLNQRSV